MISISAAVVYMACKQCDVVRSLEEILREVCSPKDVKPKTKQGKTKMETIEIERCTVCESSIIDDTEYGERI